MNGPTGPDRRRQGARRMAATAVSVGVHLSILLLLLFPAAPPPEPPEPPAVVVQLIAPPPPDPPPLPPAPAKPKPAKPKSVKSKPAKRAAGRRFARLAPRRAHPLPLPPTDKAPGFGQGLSDSELAGAAEAGDGASGGGPCDTARRLQAALRRDPLVRAAAAEFGGRAVRVWDGDWVQSGGEDGKGLAAVREAVMWEIAFAPKACRAETMHGMLLVSVPGPQGTAKLAIGKGDWRWSDLIAPAQ